MAGADEEARQALAALVRATTLLASEIAFAGIFAYVMYVTWGATTGAAPTISKPLEGTAAALAVALAAGYSGALGLQPQKGTRALSWFTRKNVLSGNFLSGELFVFIGVFVYMGVGAAAGLTYLANVDETPGILKTVAIAFGGYAIAYIGAAYKQISQ